MQASAPPHQASGELGRQDVKVLQLEEPLDEAVQAAERATAAQTQSPTYVRNEMSGMVHKASFVRSGSQSGFTVCGWRFGGGHRFAAPATCIPCEDLPKSAELICKRCLPDLRDLRRTQFARAVAVQVGGLP